jgi:sugar/nucleoside kinase (ribokinase family)
MHQDGTRVLQPLPDSAAWFECFDIVQGNEDEMRQLSPDPLSLSADALGAGVDLLVVTLGPRGAAYVAAPGFDGFGRSDSARAGSAAVRTALVPAATVDAIDPTGCGDVFGAAACARLLAGDGIEAALRHATAMAGRNASLRGAGGLSRALRGGLLVP